MKLTRLRLIGFKSFVEPTDVLIEPGLTGIVGPNGCGKSNLVEALRWVMGEASHKAMRAADMDDVIFAGSTSRPPRNTGEVMLFLDNSDRTAPAQFNEQDALEVSRRIEREAVRYRAVSAALRKAEATLCHLRWLAANAQVAEAERAKDLSVRLVAAATGAQAEAARHQVLAVASLPPLREGEAKAAASLQ